MQPPLSTTPQITPERIRTGIIVSTVISVLAILVVIYVLLKRRQNAKVKIGTVDGQEPSIDRLTIQSGEDHGDVEAGMEVGVMKEAPPVYMREVGVGERRVG